jgi:hypothetical protein
MRGYLLEVLQAFFPPHGNQCGSDLRHPTLRRKQVELCRSIACILYLQPNSQAIEVAAHSGCDGADGRTRANDEQI